MSAIDPELLMRYADDQVSLPERRLVEKRLRRDPQAEGLVAAFRDQRGRIRTAFNGDDDRNGIERCERAIDRAFERRRRAFRRDSVRRWSLPLAASLMITLIGGALIMRYAENWLATEMDRMLTERAQDRELALQTRIEALERMLSGKTLNWVNEGSGVEGSVTPLRTFQTSDGRWCREYHERTVVQGVDEERLSIACRDGEGSWRPPI